MEKSLRILLVEDDEDDAFYIKDLIREGNLDPRPDIHHVTNGDEALSQLQTEKFDLCMFDYRLGARDGIDLLRQARSLGVTIPIIFLTGQGDQETAVRAMKSGATDYLTKNSLTFETLFQSIRYAIQLKKEEELRLRAEDELKVSHTNLTRAHAELKQSLEKLQSAQDQVIQAEKLSGVGRLAAGVCHEILNPLNIINGHVQALSLERESDDDLQLDLKSIMEEIQRIEKIVSSLLKFSRKEGIEMKPASINQELESVLALTEREMQMDDIQVVRKFHQGLPEIKADVNRLRQVFLNLINNARHAMQPGASLTVVTQPIEARQQDGNTVKVPVDAIRNGNGAEPYIRIRFEDTGEGIKKENLGKLFEPFFTTKPEDKGTGLGLSVCYSIIEKHGGSIDVESEYGKGATFIIDLPMNNRIESEMISMDE